MEGFSQCYDQTVTPKALAPTQNKPEVERADIQTQEHKGKWLSNNELYFVYTHNSVSQFCGKHLGVYLLKKPQHFGVCKELKLSGMWNSTR